MKEIRYKYNSQFDTHSTDYPYYNNGDIVIENLDKILPMGVELVGEVEFNRNNSIVQKCVSIVNNIKKYFTKK